MATKQIAGLRRFDVVSVQICCIRHRAARVGLRVKARKASNSLLSATAKMLSS